MARDFDLIKYHFPENDDIVIYPISDVHLGASECMLAAWERFCNRLAAQPNAYITLGGDLINNATRSSISNVFEDVMRPRDQKRVIAEMLMPIRDRILCAVAGNHERRGGKDADDDPTYDILCKIDREDVYRENVAFLKLQIGNVNGNGSMNPTYVLVVTHGAGGGIYTGAAVNRNERFGYVVDGADAIIVGHSHKPFVTQPAKIKIDTQNNRVGIKPFKVITSTSWLEYGGYAAQKMMLPASHALQMVALGGNRKEILVTM